MLLYKIGGVIVRHLDDQAASQPARMAFYGQILIAICLLIVPSYHTQAFRGVLLILYMAA